MQVDRGVVYEYEVVGVGPAAQGSCRTPYGLPVAAPAGVSPAITSASSATFTAGSPGTFTITSSGSPAASLEVTGTLPRGVTFVDSGAGTARLAGQPADGSEGTYPLTITAHNHVGGGAAQAFTLTVLKADVNGDGIADTLQPSGTPFGSFVDATLTAVLRQNVRIPDIFMGDLHAQIAACKIAALRLREAVEKFGHNTLLSSFSVLLDRAEVMTRSALRRLAPGTYRAVDFLDNDGIDLDRRIRIEVTATIMDGAIHFDLTGSSPQVKGPINCVPSGSLAAACFAVRAVTDPLIPNNGGCFRPITLTLPEGSIVNPREPAPVNARTATIKRITNTMLKALSRVAPERVPAPNSGELLVMAWGGQRRDGRSFVTGELLAGGGRRQRL